ncbi:MAG: HAD hydrolase family protein [Halobacteriaceae archaeon]
MAPPLVLDIDGTLSRPDRSIEPRVLDVLGHWEAPVVVATGKATPYPIALCQFSGLPPRAIAETGGVAVTEAGFHYLGDPAAAEAVAAAFRERGFDPGWGDVDLVNRWRETELAVSREAPLDELRELAAEEGLDVVDTGFAYHVKDAEVSKGSALKQVAADLDRDPAEFVAVGDSANDVSTFEVVDRSFAVANADDAAKEAADVVTDGRHADGFLEAIAEWRPV